MLFTPQLLFLLTGCPIRHSCECGKRGNPPNGVCFVGFSMKRKDGLAPCLKSFATFD